MEGSKYYGHLLRMLLYAVFSSLLESFYQVTNPAYWKFIFKISSLNRLYPNIHFNGAISFNMVAACIASPALATRAMVEYGRSSAETPSLWKWHAGLGYGLLLMSMLRGSRNTVITGLLRGKKDGVDVEAGQVSVKPSFNCCWELFVGLLGLGMGIGLAVTSFKLYFEQNTQQARLEYGESVNSHLFYSAICGIVVSVVAFIVIPITICCAFCAFCTGILAKCFGRRDI